MSGDSTQANNRLEGVRLVKLSVPEGFYGYGKGTVNAGRGPSLRMALRMRGRAKDTDEQLIIVHR